jgi:hypothetical protein
MKAQLTTEQSDALNQSDDPLSLVDPRTHRVYVLVDESVHQQAMDALQRQRDEDAAAIQQGLVVLACYVASVGWIRSIGMRCFASACGLPLNEISASGLPLNERAPRVICCSPS